MNRIMIGASKQSVTFRRFFDEWGSNFGTHRIFTPHLFLWTSQWLYLRKFMLPSPTQFDSSSGSQEPNTRGWILNLLSLWNWKSALLSVMLRAPVFAVATIRGGPEVVAGAVLTEAGVCAINAGWYAAVAQVLRNRKPVWLVALVISAIVPLSGQVIEYGIHVWHQTPHRVAAVIVSTFLGAIASLFNWYAMKQGTMLVGGEETSFASDLKKFPVLLFRFFLLAPRWLGRRLGWMVLPSN
jgi:hypothetical protein